MDAGAETGPATEHYALVTVGEGRFAVGLSVLREIVPPPPIAPAPLAPPALSGFANLRGTALPVVDLAAVLGAEAAPGATPCGGNARVLVCDAGSSVGLRVGAVTGIEAVPQGAIEPLAAIGAASGGGLVTGVLRHGDALHMVLSVAAVLERAFAGLRRRAVSRVAEIRRPAEIAVGPPPAERAYLIFTLGDEEFGLPAAEVREIVAMPEGIVPIPDPKPGLPAMIRLRGRVLAMVETAQFLGVPAARRGSDAGRIIVARIAREGGEIALALTADDVREVLSLPIAAIDPAPAGTGDWISGVCNLDDGRRTVAIVDLERIADATGIRDGACPTDEDQAMQTPTEDAPEAEFLIVVFGLGGEEYGVAVDAVQEIMPMPERITRLPGAPASLDGIVNLRGAILPVVDTRGRFGLEASAPTAERQVLVLSVGGVRTGFVVDNVNEVLSVPRAAVRPAPVFESRVIGLVTEVVSLPDDGRMILLLDPAELTGRLAAPERGPVAAE